MTDAATRELQWEASQASEDGHRRRSGLYYGPGPYHGPGPGGPNIDGADAQTGGNERGARTDMADSMAAGFDRLREAAAGHDTSELNDIAGLS
jgi:hypothetical protein